MHLPGMVDRLEILCSLAWADKTGSAGIIFTDANAATRQKIRLWLDEKMAEDGLATSAARPDSLQAELTSL